MVITKIISVDGSPAALLSADVVSEASLSIGDSVEITAADGAVRIARQGDKQCRERLEKIMAELLVRNHEFYKRLADC